MILALDIGNTQLHGGVYKDNKLVLQFRKHLQQPSSDDFGIFLKGALRENSIDHKLIESICICSVVPEVIYSLKNACIKYFNITPFILEPGVKTGLKIQYKNPSEVGADRIANAIAGQNIYPDKNLVIVDFGTATTFCAIKKDRTYLGGVIIPGVKISMSALQLNTAKLPSVDILKPKKVLGQTTVDSIQSGLFFGHKFALEGIYNSLKKESFGSEDCIAIGTGGFAKLFKDENIFDVIISDLVLQGLLIANKLNS